MEGGGDSREVPCNLQGNIQYFVSTQDRVMTRLAFHYSPSLPPIIFYMACNLSCYPRGQVRLSTGLVTAVSRALLSEKLHTRSTRSIHWQGNQKRSH